MAAKKLTLAQRAKKDPELLKRALGNAGLRSKLPSSMLPPEMRKAREMNARLKQPIVPGSSMTERDLAREATASGDVRYGGVEQQNKLALGQEQARTRDLGGWYDQYLAAVATHNANVGQIGNAAVGFQQGLQQGVTGLGQQGLAGIQNPANAAAAATGMGPAGDLSGMANQALSVRQAMTGSFIAQQNAQNAAQQAYTDTLANVVAPGQKLGAMAQQSGKEKLAQDQITGTAKERGAYETTYRSEKKADEAKQILAQQIAGTNAADKAAQTKIEQDQLAETARSNRANETLTETKITTDAATKAAEAQTKAAEDAATKTEKGREIYTSGAFNGKRKADVDAMTQAQRDKLVQTFNEKTGGADKATGAKYREEFQRKYGVYPANTTEVHKATSDIAKAKVWLKRLTSAGKDGKKMDMGTAGGMLTVGGKAKDSKGNDVSYPALSPVLIRAAMDMLNPNNNGTISANTADRLHRAGYSVPGLGLTTGSAPASPKPKPPLGVGGNLGGFPK